MKTFAENKRAHFDFEIIEKFAAGILLTGHETKSIKAGRVQITGAHAIFRNQEAFLVGMEIPSFQPKNSPIDYDSGRTRKLLLKRDEIRRLIGKINEGLTAIPLRVFASRGLLKIEIALGRGRKIHDRRELIKKREVEKEIRRAKGRKNN